MSFYSFSMFCDGFWGKSFLELKSLTLSFYSSLLSPWNTCLLCDFHVNMPRFTWTRNRSSMQERTGAMSGLVEFLGLDLSLRCNYSHRCRVVRMGVACSDSGILFSSRRTFNFYHLLQIDSQTLPIQLQIHRVFIEHLPFIWSSFLWHQTSCDKDTGSKRIRISHNVFFAFSHMI